MRDENGTTLAEKETGRTEAFSDGVFAVAITLLVLEVLNVPHAPEGHPFSAGELAAALGRNWTIYVSFLISFGTILIMWMNHHSMFKMVQKTDGVFMFANGFLLLLVTLVPFPTQLLGEYLAAPAAATAAAVYAGLFVFIAIAYMALWWSAAIRRNLLWPGVSAEQIQQRMRANLVGLPAYLVAFACAFWSPLLSVAICAILWIFWAFTSSKL
ncbi:MAG: TMEM175 family protein [Chloroflexota bacterium]|nr:TMEM175 family protein [Chloroflexota bacterium]